jgi:hypothetical protein
MDTKGTVVKRKGWSRCRQAEAAWMAAISILMCGAYGCTSINTEGKRTAEQNADLIWMIRNKEGLTGVAFTDEIAFMQSLDRVQPSFAPKLRRALDALRAQELEFRYYVVEELSHEMVSRRFRSGVEWELIMARMSALVAFDVFPPEHLAKVSKWVLKKGPGPLCVPMSPYSREVIELIKLR